jgi:hypothetical protein
MACRVMVRNGVWKKGSSLFRVDMIFLVECYVKTFASIPPNAINFAAAEGRPGGDSVTIQCSYEEMITPQPIQNCEEAKKKLIPWDGTLFFKK